ncbi:MAG TPA: FAD-dependent oxidoreductase [Acidimicrobiia bacterium]
MSAPYLEAIADADPYPYWLDDVDEPESNSTLVRQEAADLCVVGGGYTGLWTAVIAKERDPDREVVLLDQFNVGSGASGRNGGFLESSLTHGVANGKSRFPREVAVLERLGLDNLNEIEAAISRYRIDCDYERTGVIDVTTSPSGADDFREDYELLRSLDQDVALLDRDQVREQVNSPTYEGGLWRKDRAALVDPARLAWGLKSAAEALGVRIYEDSKVTRLERDGQGVLVKTVLGSVRARRVALASNAFKPLLRRIAFYVVPVYDYAMVTEPLTSAQIESIGWRNRQGLSDYANQFHYYRLTADNRILWGGYDAIYYFRGPVNPLLEQRPETFAVLSRHFFETFPQLEGLKFTHLWGGAIDTCTRFAVFWGKAMSGRVAYAAGYTGLGAAASRFGGMVMLDLLDRASNDIVKLEFIRRKPIPFPPEPFRFLGIQFTRRALAREDRTGKRGWWLRLLDRLGLGFDS